MPKFDVDRFEIPPDPELICCICQCVLENAVECPCRHVFCGVCIRKWIDNRSNCPTCRHNVTAHELKPVLPLLQNMLNKLRIKCTNFRDGCIIAYTLEGYDDEHEITCEYRLLKCTYAKCNRDIIAKALEDHLKDCEFKEVLCEEGCGLMVLVKNVATHNCVEDLKRELAEQVAKTEELAAEKKRLCEQLRAARSGYMLRRITIEDSSDDNIDEGNVTEEEIFDRETLVDILAESDIDEISNGSWESSEISNLILDVENSPRPSHASSIGSLGSTVFESTPTRGGSANFSNLFSSPAGSIGRAPLASSDFDIDSHISSPLSSSSSSSDDSLAGFTESPVSSGNSDITLTPTHSNTSSIHGSIPSSVLSSSSVSSVLTFSDRTPTNSGSDDENESALDILTRGQDSDVSSYQFSDTGSTQSKVWRPFHSDSDSKLGDAAKVVNDENEGELSFTELPSSPAADTSSINDSVTSPVSSRLQDSPISDVSFKPQDSPRSIASSKPPDSPRSTVSSKPQDSPRSTSSKLQDSPRSDISGESSDVCSHTSSREIEETLKRLCDSEDDTQSKKKLKTEKKLKRIVLKRKKAASSRRDSASTDSDEGSDRKRKREWRMDRNDLPVSESNSCNSGNEKATPSSPNPSTARKIKSEMVSKKIKGGAKASNTTNNKSDSSRRGKQPHRHGRVQKSLVKTEPNENNRRDGGENGTSTGGESRLQLNLFVDLQTSLTSVPMVNRANRRTRDETAVTSTSTWGTDASVYTVTEQPSSFMVQRNITLGNKLTKELTVAKPTCSGNKNKGSARGCSPSPSSAKKNKDTKKKTCASGSLEKVQKVKKPNQKETSLTSLLNELCESESDSDHGSWKPGSVDGSSDVTIDENEVTDTEDSDYKPRTCPSYALKLMDQDLTDGDDKSWSDGDADDSSDEDQC